MMNRIAFIYIGGLSYYNFF